MTATPVQAAEEPAALATSSEGRSAGQAGSVIEIAYDQPWFAGNSLTFSAPNGCTATFDDIDFSISDLGAGNGLRSYRTFSNCWAKHYELPNFEGRSVGWGNGDNLPFEPRSIQWS